MAIQIHPIDVEERKRKFLEAEVHTAYGSNDKNPLNTSLESATIFGTNEYQKNSSHKSLDTYNRRGYIQLCMPTVNYVLAGTNGNLLAKILGVDANLITDICAGNKVYEKSTGNFVSLTDLKYGEPLILGAQILKMLIDEFDLEEARIDECYHILNETIGSTNATDDDMRETFRITKGSGDHLLIGDYYYSDPYTLKHFKRGATIDDIRPALYTKFLTGNASRIVYLLNMKDKSRLYGALNNIIVVIPKAMRPNAENRPSPMSRLYMSILRCNHDLESFLTDMSGDKAGFHTIVDKYKALDKACRLLQVGDKNMDPKKKSVLQTLMSKKGRIRRAYFSKRQDYSGRAAVIVDPFMSIRNIGIPELMLPKLMRFHLVKRYLEQPNEDGTGMSGVKLSSLRDDSPEGIRRNIHRLQQKSPQGGPSILEEVPVLLGRQPTLHKQGINAFKVKPVKGKAIAVNPLVCPGYNMDFDGDTGHDQVPQSDDACRDYTEFLDVTKNMFLAKNGECTICPRMDMIYGLYICTRSHYKLGSSVGDYESYLDVKEAIIKHKVRPDETVTIKGTKEIAGYAAFRACFTKNIIVTGGDFETTREVFVEKDNALKKAKAALDAEIRALKRQLMFLIDIDAKMAVNKQISAYTKCMRLPSMSDSTYEAEKAKALSSNVPRVELIYEYIKATEEIVDAKKAHGAIVKSLKGKLPVQEITSKTIKKYVLAIWEHGTNAFIDSVDALVALGFRVAKIYTPSISVFNSADATTNSEEYDQALDSFDKYMKEEREYYLMGMEEQAVYEQQFSGAVSTLIKEPIISTLYDKLSEKNGYRLLAECGARGSKDNLLQIFSYKGQVSKSDTESFNVVIRNNYAGQLTPMEHFLTAYGGRKGQIAKSLKTADTGYTARRMWHTSQDYVIRSQDCGTTKGIKISKKYLTRFITDATGDDVKAKVASVFESMIVGRYQLIPNEFDAKAKPINKKIDSAYAKELASNEAVDSVWIRSPLTCKCPCCVKCYGDDPSTHRDVAMYTPIGIIAAQSIGEPGTQMVMKVFQKGGVAGKGNVTSSFDKLDMFLSISKKVKESPVYDPIAWADGEVHVEPLVQQQIVTIGDNSTKVKLPLGTPMKQYAKKGEGLCLVQGEQYMPEISAYARDTSAPEWLSIINTQMYMITALFFIYLAEQEIKLQHFEVMAAAMTRHMILSTDRDDLHVGVYCSTRQLLSGDLSNTVYQTRLQSFSSVPLCGTDMLPRIMMEEVSGGLADSVLLGLTDPCESILQRIFTCQPILSQRELNDYRNTHIFKA